MPPTSLESSCGAGATRNNPADARPLKYDTPYQARVHRKYQADRRRIIAAMLCESEITGPDDELDDADPHYKIARKLAHCCRGALILTDADTGQIMVSQARCRSRLCPRCSEIRGWEMQTKIRQLLREVDDPRFLTVTLASSDRPLDDQIRRLKREFQRLRRRKCWRDHVTGGVVVLEVTYNHSRQQWHPHLHCIIDGTYWPQKEIAAAWLDVTADSSIVDIRRIGSREAMVRYVAKYVSKTSCSSKIPHNRIAEWAHAVHGSRMYQAFGHLHAVAIEQPEKPDRNYENLASLAQLSREAGHGDERAARLWRAVSLAAKEKISHDKPGAADRALARHRSIALRVRRWLRTLQNGDHSGIPRPATTHPPPGRSDHRPQRLWEEPATTDGRGSFRV